MILIVPFIAALLIVGIVLMVLGVRGKRIDDHPICRRCGFDLVGKPAESNHCSECGADLVLRPRRAIRIGHRRVRWGLISLAAVLLVAGSAGAAGAGWLRLSGKPANAYKPVWMLRSEAALFSGQTGDAALQELISRNGSGRLSKGQVDAIVASALARGVDPKAQFPQPWNNFVEQTSSLGALSDADWLRYCRQRACAMLVLDVRPRVRMGDPLPVRLADLSPAGSKFKPIPVTAELLIDGVKVIDPRSRTRRPTPLGRVADATMIASLELGPAEQGSLNPGPHMISARAVVLVQQPGGKRRWETVEVSKPWTLLPADQQTLVLRTDDAEKVRSAIKVIRAQKLGFHVRIGVEVADCPSALCFAATARYDGIEVPLGRLKAARQPDPQRIYLTGEARGLWQQEIDIVLRSDAETAVRTLDLQEIWNGEIVLEKVRMNP